MTERIRRIKEAVPWQIPLTAQGLSYPGSAELSRREAFIVWETAAMINRKIEGR